MSPRDVRGKYAVKNCGETSTEWNYTFYLGVLHPVVHTLSRLLEEPSLATTF
jgi:hypothetical protein